MFKSMTRIVSKTSNPSQRNGYRARMPKTKFNLNDRSISSPRLKSFPAERIKRIDRSPIRNSSQNDNIPPRQTAYSGQGDTMPDFQNPQSTRNYSMPSQNTTSTSEQQVSRNVYPMKNHANHSDLVIPSSAMEISSVSRPHHRPFVSNVCQANTTLRDNSPRKFVTEHSNETSQIIPRNQVRKIIDNETVEPRDPWKNEDDSMAQANGRQIEDFSEINRSNVVSNSEECTIVPGREVIPQKSLTKDQNVSSIVPTTDGTCPNIQSRKIQPILSSNISHYYDTENSKNDQQTQRQYVQTYTGMTSPQDVAINQIKKDRRLFQLGNYVCTSNQGQTNLISNNQPRAMDNFVPVVCANIPRCYNYPGDNETRVMKNQQQYFARNWQRSPQQQYYIQQNEMSGQIPQQLSNSVKFVDDQNVKCQSLQQKIPQQYENLQGKWHVTQHQQQQHCNQQNETVSQISQRPSSNVKLENHRKIEEKRKSLRFSPAMIRDQELLVTTMRQQGINEDIMRRQFDALLAEQRKQLLYLEQLENPRTNETNKLQQCRRVQRKISRIEEDGKPDWMMHITPPRIPYSVVEKMQLERQFESRALTQKNSNVVEMNSENPPRKRINETYDRSSQEYHQNSWQMADSNVWQTQPKHFYVSNDTDVPKENQAYQTNVIATDQYQQRYYDYPVYQRQQTHRHNEERKIQSENCQIRDDKSENKQRYELHEKNVRPVEASSLLKLRVYKEVVKRQKQNNGLQDPQTVKEAMEALKNPVNRKGLEYLENLNKKREKPVSLNGAQDPREMIITDQQDYFPRHQPMTKIPSANGLENTRNSNNPAPRETLRKIDEFHASEYPRQRKIINSRDCCALMAERENGTVAMMKNHQFYDSHESSNNQNSPTINSRLARANFSYPGNALPEIMYNEGKSLASPNVTMPLPLSQNQQPRCYVQQAQQYHENNEKICDRMNAENFNVRTSEPQSGFYVDEITDNVQQRESYCSRKNNQVQEPVMIGGIQFLARKPEYTQSAISSQHYPTNHGKSFNPTIACQ